jgi:hypothetical protein
MDLFSWVKNYRTYGKMFVSYALFLLRVDPDPHACHGIWKKCYPAFGPLDLGWLPWDSAAAGEVFFGKQESEVFPRVW